MTATVFQSNNNDQLFSLVQSIVDEIKRIKDTSNITDPQQIKSSMTQSKQKIRSLLAELINNYLNYSSSRNNIDHINKLIQAVVQQLPQAQWSNIGDIFSYLFKLIPFLAYSSSNNKNNNSNNNNDSISTKEDDELVNSLIITIQLLLGLLYTDINLLNLFIKETIEVFQISIDLLTSTNNGNIGYPLLLSAYNNLDYSIRLDQSMSTVISRELVVLPIDGHQSHPQPHQQSDITKDGILILIQSADKLINLQFGLLLSVFSILQHYNQFFKEHFNTLSVQLNEYLKLSLQHTKLIYPTLKLFNTVIKYTQIPNYLNIMDSIIQLLSNFDRIKDHTLVDDQLAEALEWLFMKFENTSEIIDHSEEFITIIPHIMSHTNSERLKKSICQVYYRIIELSPPHYYTAFQMIVFFSDKSIHNILYNTFKLILTNSIQKEETANEQSDNGILKDNFSSLLLQDLITFASNKLSLVNIFKSNQVNGPEAIHPLNTGKIKSILVTSQLLNRILFQFQSRSQIQPILDLFSANVNSVYDYLMKQKELNEIQMDILKESLILSKEIFSFTISGTNLIKNELVYNLAMISTKYPNLIPKIAGQSLEIQILSLECLVWLPSDLNLDARKSIILENLNQISIQDDNNNEEIIQLETIKLLPIFMSVVSHSQKSLLHIEITQKLQALIKTSNSSRVLNLIGFIGGYLICLKESNGISDDKQQKLFNLLQSNSNNNIKIVNDFILKYYDSIPFDTLLPGYQSLVEYREFRNIWLPLCLHGSSSNDANSLQITSIVPTKPNNQVLFYELFNNNNIITKYYFLQYTLNPFIKHFGSTLSNDIINQFLEVYFPLISKPDEIIRKVIIELTLNLIKFDSSKTKENILTLVFKNLKPYCQSFEKRENLISILQLLERIILLLVDLHLIDVNQKNNQKTNQVYDSFLIVLCILIENLGRNSTRVICVEIIEQISKKLKTTLKAIIQFISKDLYPRIIDNILKNQRSLIELSKLLGFPSIDQFLESILPMVLPHLFFTKNIEILNELKKYAPKLNDITRECLPKIFEFVFMNSNDQQHLTSNLAFIASFINEGTGTLITYFSRSFINELILNLGYINDGRHQAAINSLEYAFLFSYSSASDAKSLDINSFEKFLDREFLSAMNFFTVIMTSKQKTIQEKEVMLHSFHQLLILMKSHVNLFRPKIMAFLKLALKTPLEEMSLDIWITFVKLLDVNAIGPILNQLLFSVLPYLPNYPSKSLHIFEYLIIQHKDKLSPYFKTIPFLPKEYPSLKPIIQILESEQGRIDLSLQIRQLIDLFNNENNDVKIMTLNRLKVLIQENRNEVNHRIHGTTTDSIDPIISDLMKTLLIGCRDPFLKVQVGFLECIGELGAIDPAKFDFSLRSEIPAIKEYKELGTDLIEKYLAKFVVSPSNPTPQDRAGYAIQEILKICGGESFWRGLTPEVKDITFPYLSSEYNLPLISKKQDHVIGTTYFTANIPYKKWVTNWIVDLLYKTTEPLNNIFMSCRGIVKDDLKICHFILPYLILNIIESKETNNIQSIHSEILAVLRNDTETNSESSQMCTQMIFQIITSLNYWADARKKLLMPEIKSRNSKVKRQSPIPPQVLIIQDFLADIPEDILASASYRCKSLNTSLIHIESHIRREVKVISNQNKFAHHQQRIQKEQIMHKNLSLLQKIYYEMDDIDALIGLSTIRQSYSSSIDESIMEFEGTGRWSEALIYYNNAALAYPDHFNYKLGILNCMFNLGQYESLITMIGGLKKEANTSEENLAKMNSFSIQSAWRLSSWEQVEESLKLDYEQSFEVSVGKALLSLYKVQEKEFQLNLIQARSNLSQYLAGASFDSYQRCYPYIVQSHILQEIEHSYNLNQISNPNNNNSPKMGLNLKNFKSEWNERFKFIQPSFKYREQILAVRREIMKIHNQTKEVSDIWIKIGKYSRNDGKFETALNALLKPNPNTVDNPSYLVLEKAKLMYRQNNNYEAMNLLEHELKKLPQSNNSNKDQLHSKFHLLIARWRQQTGSTHHSELIYHFKQACLYQWEKGHFYLGKYYDNLIMNYKKTNPISTNHPPSNPLLFIKYTKKILKAYGDAIKLGHHYVYQTVPRLLTLWFEIGAIFDKPDKIKKTPVEQKLLKLKPIMQDIEAKVPAYIWLIFIQQLNSRICHRNKETWETLESIISKVLIEYPQQGNWCMISQIQSNHSQRKERARSCFEKSKKSEFNFINQNQIKSLSTQLIDLSNFGSSNQNNNNTPKVQPFKLSEITAEFRSLHTMRSLTVIIPTQKSMNPTLPPNGKPDPKFNVFPPNLPTIQSFVDNVDVMPSLIRPKKILINDNYGSRHTFLCKPKDDLRKDSRLQEYNTVINKLLKKDPSCRKRNLRIRTYAVIPLNEECGMIEWVPNTTCLRNILNQLYEKDNIILDRTKIQEYDASPDKLAAYEKFLNIFPPIFHRWFLNKFSEPSAWLDARNNYSRSVAVASMVGNSIGLGDRHCENILFDENTGECVPIDLNCIFWKGKSFNVPEKVPFRLTQNMVDGLGISGIEGTFKKSCENALRVIRSNKDALLSVLESFIYDPSVEWNSKKNRQPSGEVENGQALEVVRQINAQLQGIPDVGLQLSIEGQVNALIQEAIDAKNLSEMYVGWTPFL